MTVFVSLPDYYNRYELVRNGVGYCIITYLPEADRKITSPLGSPEL